jgi:L-cystine uptake protein TcyP (sodium:dicarboxylate symporter family)
MNLAKAITVLPVLVPLMIIIDPLADMVRTMLNVAINCMDPSLAGGRAVMPATQPSQ